MLPLIPLLLVLAYSALLALAENLSAAQTLFPLPDKWLNGTAPPPEQTKKNCKGSSSCHRTLSNCAFAAGHYVNERVYNKYTSYTSRDSFFPNGCTAIFSLSPHPPLLNMTSSLTGPPACDDDDYGKGLTGAQIKWAFNRLWAEGDGKHCRACGSSYMVGKCHVTANYCQPCKNVVPDEPPPPQPLPTVAVIEKPVKGLPKPTATVIKVPKIVPVASVGAAAAAAKRALLGGWKA